MGFTFQDFRAQMSVEAEILASDTGSSQLTLMKDDSNYIISVIAKWKEKILMANSKVETVWGDKVIIDDNFDFAKGYLLMVRIEASTSCYGVFVNNTLVCRFPHATQMPIADIKRAKFFGEDDQLKRFSVLFESPY